MSDEKRIKARNFLDVMMGKPFREAMESAADSGNFGSAMASMAIEHAFADTWSRPGLDRKTRSIITLSILLAQGQISEFRNHVRFGLNNGLTPSELEELVLHATIYSGFPAASSAMSAVVEVLRENNLLSDVKTAEERGLY